MMTKDKPQLIPFKAWHLELLGMSENMPDELCQTLAHEYELRGLCYSAVVDADFVGAAGVLELWDGVGQAWLVPGPQIQQHILWFIHAIREWLRDSPMRRVQTYVLAGNTQYRRLAELLGFSYEGTLVSFGPNGEDYHIYATVKR